MRDIFVSLGLVLVIGLAWNVIHNQFDPRLKFVAPLAAIMLVNVVIKLVWPSHLILRQCSWVYLAAITVLLLTTAMLAGDVSIVGYWTIPAVIVLVLLCWAVQATLGPRFGDDGPSASG